MSSQMLCFVAFNGSRGGGRDGDTRAARTYMVRDLDTIAVRSYAKKWICGVCQCFLRGTVGSMEGSGTHRAFGLTPCSKNLKFRILE